jgi:hypothetical protein
MADRRGVGHNIADHTVTYRAPFERVALCR